MFLLFSEMKTSAIFYFYNFWNIEEKNNAILHTLSITMSTSLSPFFPNLLLLFFLSVPSTSLTLSLSISLFLYFFYIFVSQYFSVAPPRVIFVTFLFSSVSESLTPHCKDTVQYHKFETNIHRNETARPCSHFLHSLLAIYIPRIGLHILLQQIGKPIVGI